MKSGGQSNAFVDQKILVPEKKNVVKMKSLLENFPELGLQENFFPVSRTDKNESHTCESIHDLAYNDTPFLSPLLISALMILLDKPISVYILEDGSFDDLMAAPVTSKKLKIKESTYNTSIVKFLFDSKTPNDAFIIGKYRKIPEKRIGVMNLDLYKRNKSVQLLEKVSFTKTNWGSFAFIQRKTVNETMRERYTLILKYKLINLLSRSFGFNSIHEVCPRVAAAAATLQYSLDVSSGLDDAPQKVIKSDKEKEENVESSEKVVEKSKEETKESESVEEDEKNKEESSSSTFVTPQKGSNNTQSSSPKTKQFGRKRPEQPLSAKKFTFSSKKFRGNIDTLLSFKN